MRPPLWHPPSKLSPTGQAIVARIRRAKLFVFLRRVRHELFSAAFQTELATLFRDSPQGHPPVPPAPLALVTGLQASTEASDDEALEALTMDRRWQLVVACLDCETPPLQQSNVGPLSGGPDRPGAGPLAERTHSQTGRAGWWLLPRTLRGALDTNPLWGAGRVEDTYNLRGHALRKVLSVIARQEGWGLAAVAAEAGAEVVAGSSLKAALHLNWDDAAARETELGVALAALEAVECWVAGRPGVSKTSRVTASMEAVRQVRGQDGEVAQDGSILAAPRRGARAAHLP